MFWGSEKVGESKSTRANVVLYKTKEEIKSPHLSIII